jgi:hypothetical protein
MREVPARPSRGLKSDFSDVLGSGAGSARSTSKSIIRMGGVYAVLAKIATEYGQRDKMLMERGWRINQAG